MQRPCSLTSCISAAWLLSGISVSSGYEISRFIDACIFASIAFVSEYQAPFINTSVDNKIYVSMQAVSPSYAHMMATIRCSRVIETIVPFPYKSSIAFSSFFPSHPQKGKNGGGKIP